MPKRPLAPSFIKKLDDYLLLHQPEVWSTRFHLVLWYGLLFILALAAVCFVFPGDAREISDMDTWMAFVSILSVIGFIVWLVYLLRFNVFKRYGHITAWGRLRVYLLYFVCILVFSLAIFIPPLVEGLRTQLAYSESNIVKEINTINKKLCQVERDTLNKKWWKDSVLLIDKTVEWSQLSESVKEHRSYFTELVDSIQLKQQLEIKDSIQRINDSIYVFFNCPDYQYLKPYELSAKAEKELLTNKQLYFEYVIPDNDLDTALTANEIRKLIKRYTPRNDNDYYRYHTYTANNQESYIQPTIIEAYHIDGASRGIDRILRKQQIVQWRYIGFVLLTVYFVSLGIALLLFVFRHSTVKTFFVTLAAAAILLIITAMILALCNAEDLQAAAVFYFYYIVFGIVAFSVFSNRKRSIITGIAINLTTLLFPALLPVGVGLYLDHQCRYDNVNILAQEYCYPYRDEIAIGSGIVTSLLVMVFILLVAHRLYRRWYALPED